MGQGHEHDDDADEHSELDPMDVRVRALETLLTEKGYVDPAALDELIDTYQTRVGPRNGARVVARAWVDADFRAWLTDDATAAIASLGFAGRQGEHMVAVEQSDDIHHMVVCTLCSCYPWPVLGLPPTWYKSAPYRSRVVRDPRGVLADFGVALPDGVDIRIWDSTAEVRYLVIPQRPAGTDGWPEERLAELVTRDSMIGVGRPLDPAALARIDPTEVTDRYVSHADLGGSTGHGRVEPEPESVVFHHRWEARALALTLAAGAPGGWNIDMSRRARETLADYSLRSYYEIWTEALEQLVVEHGLVSRAELVAGRAASPGDPDRRVLVADQVAAVLARGGPADREPNRPARFEVGDPVVTRAGSVDHHTRLPAYVAGRTGTIERVHGAHVFPDTNAHGLGEQPHWLYTVVFEATDLWDDAAPGQCVSVDAFEPYLSPVVSAAP